MINLWTQVGKLSYEMGESGIRITAPILLRYAGTKGLRTFTGSNFGCDKLFQTPDVRIVWKCFKGRKFRKPRTPRPVMARRGIAIVLLYLGGEMKWFL